MTQTTTLNKEEIFDIQIQTIKDRGCPSQIVDLLRKKRKEVISRASRIEARSNLPFLPVIPRSHRGVYDLIVMVDRKGFENGASVHLNPAKIMDIDSRVNEPYYIFGVEDGRSMSGQTPRDLERGLNERKRSSLTISETISVCVHTDVLSCHPVVSLGSRYKHISKLTGLKMSDKGPLLVWCYLNDKTVQWKAPSCLERSANFCKT